MPRWPKLSGDGRGRLLRRRAGAFLPFLPSRISRGGLRNEEHLYLRGDKPAAGGRLRHTRSEAHGFGEAVSRLRTPTRLADGESVMSSNEPTTRDVNASYRAAQFEKLALHWAQRGDLRQAALALRRARLEAQTALLESYRGLAEQGH